MLILIAESKTMSACQHVITAEDMAGHAPCYDSFAGEVMARIGEMNVGEIASRVKISPKMATQLSRMAYEFPNKALGEHAITAFTGVVFKALDYATLSSAAAGYIDRNVRLVSSLYGWLSPCDFVKSYRLDFTTSIAPDNLTMSAYWRSHLSSTLINTLKESGSHDVIDLLPTDAAKCFDWKEVSKVADVWKVDFRQVEDGGSLRTPHAGRLKTLRGLLLRHMALEDIKTPQHLMTLQSDDFIPMESSQQGHIEFGV